MKTFNRLLTLLAAASLFAAGCVDEDPAYLGQEQPAAGSDDRGYLSASGLTMRVIADTDTETGDDDTGDETERPASRAAGQIDTDSFLVEITDAAGGTVLSTTCGELSTLLAEPMALKVGTYTVTVRSEASMPGAAWEHPVYGGQKTLSVSKANTKEHPVEIGEVVCTLQNIKVTVKLSKDLVDKLTDDTQATVSLGDNSLVFPVVGGQAGYFLPVAESNTLNFVLAGKFVGEPEPEPVQFSKTIANVKAGQWRRITLVIAYADKGGIHLDIQVDSFIQDETVVVDGTDGAWEAIYEEPSLFDPPTIAWEGHDFSEPFQLKATMFDADNKCTEPFDFHLTAPAGVASFTVDITSTNADFIDALAVANVPESFDLCQITPTHEAYTLLAAFGFPLGDALKGATEKSFGIAGAMPLLYNAPGFDGEHTFAFRIADAEGQTAEAALVLVVDRNNEAGEPDIVWKGNYVDGTPYDIDREEPYELDERMQIDIEFTAPAGIRSLVVTIISETLDVTEVELPQTFDLANIQDPDLARTLGAPDPDGFGFPINDKVRNQTSVPFCITPFVKLLPIFEGVHEFKLDVTDNNGVTVTKSVKIHVTPAA